MGRGAIALWCALLVAARAAAYTVDCNHEYTDCDSELSKLNAEDEELSSKHSGSSEPETTQSTTTTSSPPTRSSITTEVTTEFKEVATEESSTTEIIDVLKTVKPQPRLLNINVDELQTFANALHNQTKDKKPLPDLSDVNLDDEEDEEPKINTESNHKQISDKFYSNLQAPFHLLDRTSDETEGCKDNEISYKVGEQVERGCEEICECSSSGNFECSPRCKLPYIRQGRRITDPLCFESPVDECCSLLACATGNGDTNPTTLEICRYGNDTYPVGAQWNIGCEQTCTCEKNSIVTCKPRCERHPPSEKCINVQDPHDVCCEVQVCDVSQDVHEEQENATSSTTTTTEAPKSGEEVMLHERTMRPLVLAEPIGSIKVLQNNTVQVNLIYMNNSLDPIHLLLSDDNGKSFKDVELKYSNLILNLEGGKDYILKTRETGTKFNFTITASDTGSNEVPNENVTNITKVGCYQDGIFYAVGEEFHIGCSELCECTGPDTHECAALVCPSHVGLELMSKGCVRWAPNPPPQPPNCCPRAARCLSDGTCHYKGVPIPNWSEVPIELTGCNQRCFCENGDLECQETCTPLPPVPPQTLRCPPMHRPAAVNISDDDCCKQWGCLPNAGSPNKTTFQTYITPTVPSSPVEYMTPIPFTFVTPPSIHTTSELGHKHQKTSSEFHKQSLYPFKTLPKFDKSPSGVFNDIPKYAFDMHFENPRDNVTVFTLDHADSPIQNIHQGSSLKYNYKNGLTTTPSNSILSNSLIVPLMTSKSQKFMQPQIPNNFVQSHDKMHEMIEHLSTRPKPAQEPLIKIPMSKEGHSIYFLPTRDSKSSPVLYKKMDIKSTPPPMITQIFHSQPSDQNYNYVPHQEYHSSQNIAPNGGKSQYKLPSKQVTVLRYNDLKPRKTTDDNNLWHSQSNTHLLTKDPNPYATLLLRRVLKPTFVDHEAKIPHDAERTYSALDLERILNQMEVESEVNRNLGRSADKNNAGSVAGQVPTAEYPTTALEHPKPPPFLPTISPELHYPREDLPDDQNDIHRPINTVPGLPPGLPPGLHIPSSYGEDNKKLSVLSLKPDSPTSVMMLFGLPPVLVGLRGSVDLRYTDKAEDDVSRWYSQVFAPEDEVLTTPRLEFRLTGLKPSTTYKIRGKLYLHNLPVEPESEIWTVRTLDLPTVAPVEEKQREIDSQLTVVDVNDTVAHVSWRHFNEDELQFIDGIQVRYRPVGTPIFSMTELLHHSRSAAELHDLRPGVRYEASLVLVPPPKATTELHDPGNVEFTTAPYVDPYNWTVTIEARTVGSEAAEVTWRGVPSPAERWVRVYRAAHACLTGPQASQASQASRREHDAFRLAARDLPPAVTLTGLEPDTRCRVWLELFLTNGKVKTSNVLEIHTKSLDLPDPIDNEIEAASSSIAGSRGSPRGDYYGALVIVGVVAALGALTSLLLLLVVVRRHRPRSVPITPVPSAPRDSSLPPYDNPAFKLELQQETMDL